jgi:TRAP-type uncharacterized transport system substrate-binding protein
MRLATGPEGEHEYQMALIYEQYMQEQAVDVEAVPTAGSLETMALLQSGEVDAGFIPNAANIESEISSIPRRRTHLHLAQDIRLLTRR